MDHSEGYKEGMDETNQFWVEKIDMFIKLYQEKEIERADLQDYSNAEKYRSYYSALENLMIN